MKFENGRQGRQPRHLRNVRTFCIKRLDVLPRMSRRFGGGMRLRFAQVADDGFHLRFQERVAVRTVMKGFQFFDQQGATVYPSVEGLEGRLLRGVRLVEQGQFGFQVGA